MVLTTRTLLLVLAKHAADSSSSSLVHHTHRLAIHCVKGLLEGGLDVVLGPGEGVLACMLGQLLGSENRSLLAVVSMSAE